MIGSKLLELNFNEDKSPTFVESGYSISLFDFDNFIKNVESFESDMFSFDDQDRFDGFMYLKSENDTNNSYLILKIAIELTNISVYIPINDITHKGIIADLRVLYKLIETTIKENLEANYRFENPDKYDELFNETLNNSL